MEITDSLQILKQAFPDLEIEVERDMPRHRDLITIRIPSMRKDTTIESSDFKYMIGGTDIVAETNKWLKSIGYIKE